MSEQEIVVHSSEQVSLQSPTDDGQQEMLQSHVETRIGTQKKRLIRVYLPLTAQNIKIRALMRNTAWPDGCDLGSSKYKGCKLDGSDCSVGWSKVSDVRILSTPTNRVAQAYFHNWSDCNARFGKLQVTYNLPAGEADEEDL